MCKTTHWYFCSSSQSTRKTEYMSILLVSVSWNYTCSISCVLLLTAHMNDGKPYTITSIQYLLVSWLVIFLRIIMHHELFSPSRIWWRLLFAILTLICFKKCKIVSTLCLHVSHSRFWLIRGCLDTQITSIKFYIMLLHTILCFTWNIIIAYILRTFHSVLAY